TEPILKVEKMERLSRHALIIAPLLLLGGLTWSLEVGLSILIGELLAWVNFRWMTAGVNRVLTVNTEVEGESPRRISLAKYLLRLLLIFSVLFAMIHFSFLSPIGTLLGLSIFVLSGMLEAILLLIQRKA